MPCSKNKVVIASAGSLKTTYIVEQALGIRDRNVLITTYTNENVSQINSCLIRRAGHVPNHITVLSWYSFLLQDGVRPYQNYMTSRGRINTINFTASPSHFTLKTDIDNYYLTDGNNMYGDRVSAFICDCDERSSGLVVKRLERAYGHIFIDELQDLAGHDLEFLEKLFRSSISILAVGDPRQATYSTNKSLKNKQFKLGHVVDWVRAREAKQLCSLEVRTDCYRCNQAICDFADALFPDLPKTSSKNCERTGHDGVFYIKKSEVLDYVARHKPTVLRYDRRAKTMNLSALNIGITKGRTYGRVLIFPTKPMRDYINTGDLPAAHNPTKLYVAVTRAKYSVAFVI
jgi:hypothetical protein